MTKLSYKAAQRMAEKKNLSVRYNSPLMKRKTGGKKYAIGVKGESAFMYFNTLTQVGEYITKVD